MRKFISGPNNGSQFRALGLGQRPFLDAPFTTHLRDLESFRRKAPHTPISNFGSHSTSNGVNSDCQGYKPNAPQVHGKLTQESNQQLFHFCQNAIYYSYRICIQTLFYILINSTFFFYEQTILLWFLILLWFVSSMLFTTIIYRKTVVFKIIIIFPLAEFFTI